MRHALIDEAVADVPLHGLRTRRGAGDFGFLELAIAGIGQQEKGITRARASATREVSIVIQRRLVRVIMSRESNYSDATQETEPPDGESDQKAGF